MSKNVTDVIGGHGKEYSQLCDMEMELDINAAMKVIRAEIDDMKAERAAVAV